MDIEHNAFIISRFVSKYIDSRSKTFKYLFQIDVCSYIFYSNSIIFHIIINDNKNKIERTMVIENN